MPSGNLQTWNRPRNPSRVGFPPRIDVGNRRGDNNRMADCRRLCVYCGSRHGNGPAYAELAAALGRRCAAAGVGVVFGGGRVGLMGELAGATLGAGGAITGIIPEHLRQREVAHAGLTELVVVDSMHARKRAMAERADAFCVLPGGLGSLDEVVEIITWKQLGLHDKPIVLLDHAGFWQPFLDLLGHQAAHGFVDAEHRRLFDVVTDIDGVFAAIERHPEPAATLQGARL